MPAPQAPPAVPPTSPAVAPPQTWPAAAPEPAGAPEPPPPTAAAEEPPPDAAPAPALPAPSGPEVRPTVPVSAAEAAWLSGDAPAAAPDLAAEHREPVATARAAPGGRPVRRRMAVFAAAAGVVAVAGAALLWGTLRGRAPPPPREAARAAVAPAPPPAPSPAAPAPAAVEPAPERAAEPVPAPADESGLAPPRTASAAQPGHPADARFEAGTVTVARARRRHPHALDQQDRKLLDLLARKDLGTDPPEQVEQLDLDTGRSLSPAAVERVVAEGQGAFSSCLTRALKSRQPGAAARRATLLLTVDPGGEVATAWVAEAEVDRSALGACLTAAARRLVFPSFEGDPVDVSVPLVLGVR